MHLIYNLERYLGSKIEINAAVLYALAFKSIKVFQNLVKNYTYGL